MNEPRAGFYGYTLKESKAPELYRFWLRKYGISGHYDPVSVAPEDFEATLRRHLAEGWRGGSVTMPHKEAAWALSDDLTDRARAIGSSNTLMFEDGKIIGDNTDGVGFLANLRDQAGRQFDTTKPAFVFGAGGAGRAVIYALLDAGVPELRLANRSRDRAEALARLFGARINVIEWDQALAFLPGAATIVNTTSMGMVGQPPLPVSPRPIDDDAVVADIVARPRITPFLTEAKARGLTIVGGLGMLLHQAPPGFEAWFGVTPVVEQDVWEVMLALQ